MKHRVRDFDMFMARTDKLMSLIGGKGEEVDISVGVDECISCNEAFTGLMNEASSLVPLDEALLYFNVYPRMERLTSKPSTGLILPVSYHSPFQARSGPRI